MGKVILNSYVWEMRDKEGEIGWQGEDVHI